MAVLSGDIGTGKTTVCRTVLEQLDMKLFTSLVLNPFLSGEELLREILLDFGVVSREAVRSGRVIAASRHELISTLQEFLTSLVPIGASGVLIIDEAQHLSPQVLEEIRVLSNLETNQSKLLQIVLVGQLNLLDLLRQPEQRQLDQRDLPSRRPDAAWPPGPGSLRDPPALGRRRDGSGGVRGPGARSSCWRPAEASRA